MCWLLFVGVFTVQSLTLLLAGGWGPSGPCPKLTANYCYKTKKPRLLKLSDFWFNCIEHILEAKYISAALLLSGDKPFVGMCFAIFRVSFDKNSFNLPGQGFDSYFCSCFLTDFEYLSYMTSYYVTISINS